MSTREYMAKRLREFRLAKGLSVDQVGALIGRSGKTISAWEVGRGQPDADMLVELCALYEARIEDFYSKGDQTGINLSSEEYDLLAAFRLLNDEGRNIALSVMSALSRAVELIS